MHVRASISSATLMGLNVGCLRNMGAELGGKGGLQRPLVFSDVCATRSGPSRTGSLAADPPATGASVLAARSLAVIPPPDRKYVRVRQGRCRSMLT